MSKIYIANISTERRQFQYLTEPGHPSAPIILSQGEQVLLFDGHNDAFVDAKIVELGLFHVDDYPQGAAVIWKSAEPISEQGILNGITQYKIHLDTGSIERVQNGVAVSGDALARNMQDKGQSVEGVAVEITEVKKDKLAEPGIKTKMAVQ